MNKEEIAAVLAEHMAWLESDGGKSADLSGASLAYAYLTGANLTGVNLTGANLTYARLDGCNLARSNLSGASLAYAYLTGADLTCASLVGCNLARSNLSGANLTCADFTGADLTGVNLTGANLTYARLDGCKIDDKTVVNILRRATRSDGYEFFLWHCQEGYFITAGCHIFNMEDARKHWTNTRQGTALGNESLDILDFFDGAIKRQGSAA